MGNSTPLTNLTPSETFIDLLHMSNSNSGLNSTLQNITDGAGIQAAVQISTSGFHVASGFQIRSVDMTAEASDLNKLDRNYDDGVVESNKAIVADAGGNISFSGGGASFSSATTSVPYGYLKEFDLGGHSNTLVEYSGTASSTGIYISPASGQYHKIILENSKTRLNIDASDQMARDITSSSSTSYYLKLFVQQGGSGGHEWAWNTSSTFVKWEPTYPSGYNGSPYTSGIPLINDTGCSYSGGVLGSHLSVGGEVDIVEMYSLDRGVTWYAKRAASGIV